MQGLALTDGAVSPFTAWTALLFGSRTRMRIELTSG